MMFLPNRATNMMCQNNFGGKMIISLINNIVQNKYFLRINYLLILIINIK